MCGGIDIGCNVEDVYLLSDFNALTRKEQSAFIAWFSGGRTLVTKYGEQKNVFFGKAECEWVDFDDFWLKKLPALGWITVSEDKHFIAIGMVGQPEAIRYSISATNKGVSIRNAYWERLERKGM